MSLSRNRRVLGGALCAVAVTGITTLAAMHADAATSTQDNPVGSACHHVRWVYPGQSIQAAIDASHPGDTVRIAPGAYTEQLHINTNDVAVIGSGDRTVLTSPASPTTVAEPDTGLRAADGITVGSSGTTISNVQISDLKVTGFSGAGVTLDNSASSSVKHVVANDAYDGIEVVSSTHATIAHDAVTGAGHGGIDVVNSMDSRAVIEHNHVTDSRHGILVLSSTEGTMSQNDVTGNNVGVLILTLGPTGHSSHWQVTGNRLVENNRPAGSTPNDDISGAGIALTGVDHVTVSFNEIVGNRPAGPSTYSGGVLFVAFPSQGRGLPIPSTANTVTYNYITDNAPYDIAHDALSTGNTVADNLGDPTMGTIPAPTGQ